METKLAIFKGKEIRRILHGDEWWFSVVDVCGVLTDSRDTGAYWRKLKQRMKKEQPEYAILTAEISKAAFGMTPSEYKELKGLKRENLRDHMTDLELIFSMLGEAATTEIARKQDVQGFPENKVAARKGGKI